MRKKLHKQGLVVRVAGTRLHITHGAGGLIWGMHDGTIETDWKRGAALAALARRGMVERCPKIEIRSGRTTYRLTEWGKRAAQAYRRRSKAVQRWRRKQAAQRAAQAAAAAAQAAAAATEEDRPDAR